MQIVISLSASTLVLRENICAGSSIARLPDTAGCSHRQFTRQTCTEPKLFCSLTFPKGKYMCRFSLIFLFVRPPGMAGCVRTGIYTCMVALCSRPGRPTSVAVSAHRMELAPCTHTATYPTSAGQACERAHVHATQGRRYVCYISLEVQTNEHACTEAHLSRSRSVGTRARPKASTSASSLSRCAGLLDRR